MKTLSAVLNRVFPQAEETKTFCVLEQAGNRINEETTLMHKKQFNTEFSDFYRLNWETMDDPNAFIYKNNITWSEGRSLLYEKVPKKYDYYIFIDDDITFELADKSSKGSWNVAPTIKNLLEEYKPVMATLHSNKWHFSGIAEELEKQNKGGKGLRKVFPFAGQDMDCQILSKSFAEVMFPVVYHGAGFATWYLNYVCHKLFPKKQMVFSDVFIRNLRYNPSQPCRKLPHCCGPQAVINRFNENTFDKDFPMSREEVIERNVLACVGEIDKAPVEFSSKDLAKIYDVNNPDWQGRKTIVNKKIVGIGFRRTGTTSLGECFRKVFGYKTCGFRQRSSPELLEEWQRNEFGPEMKKLVAESTAFEDLPRPFLYKLIDKNCLDTKFILTTRDSEKWFESWRRYFKERAFEHPGEIRPLEIIYGISKPEQIDKEKFIERFNRHNREVMEHFKDRPDDLLVVDWSKGSDADNWKKLCDFLGEKIPEVPFPKKMVGQETRNEIVEKGAKCLFVHIPKTGGTAVVNLCKDHIPHNPRGHRPYAEVLGEMEKRGLNFDFSFSIVRNPWARFVSAYEYAKAPLSKWHNNVDGRKPHPDYAFLKGKSFKECVKLKKAGYNFKHPSLKFDQSHFIADDCGKILVDYVLHQENLEEEMKHIKRRLGLTEKLGQANVGGHPNYKGYYDKESKEMIAEIYKQDIGLFGYGFGD